MIQAKIALPLPHFLCLTYHPRHFRRRKRASSIYPSYYSSRTGARGGGSRRGAWADPGHEEEEGQAPSLTITCLLPIPRDTDSPSNRPKSKKRTIFLPPACLGLQQPPPSLQSNFPHPRKGRERERIGKENLRSLSYSVELYLVFPPSSPLAHPKPRQFNGSKLSPTAM